MTKQNTQLATTEKAPLSTQLADKLGIDRGTMIAAIKSQCFNIPADKVTDAQLATYMQVANTLAINPLLPGMLYAYPTKNGGIQPMIGPDAVFKMLAEHPEVEGWETSFEIHEDGDISCTAQIHHKRFKVPIRKTCFLSEWKIANNPNWNSRPKHMLEMRTLKQGARQVIHGIPFDEDERAIIEMHDEGGVYTAAETETPPERPAPPAPRRGVAAAKAVAAETEKPEPKKAEAVEAKPKPADKPAEKAEPKKPEKGKDAKPAEEEKKQAEVVDAEFSEEESSGNLPDAKEEQPEPRKLNAIAAEQVITELSVIVTERRAAKVNNRDLLIMALQGEYTGTAYWWGDDAKEEAFPLETPLVVTLKGVPQRAPKPPAAFVEAVKLDENL